MSRAFRVTIERQDGVCAFDAADDEYLLYSMIDAGLASPMVCEQGWCLACAARLIEGEVDSSAALTHYPEDEAAGFVLICSALPRSDLVLRQHITETRREMTQLRTAHNLLARAYPPGERSGHRRGRAKAKKARNEDQQKPRS
ncbi:2Fe-2S iron-sulfur cluster-binding protein [Labrys portucalensis]|uniref:2Fe-2S iron-sulfur cluster-binding protein n=1 Tax=Labrys neptuniae TaxID=376174 RepID=A0ABV6ZMY8_9HYPH